MYAFPPEGTGSASGAMRDLINKRVQERVSGSHVVSPSVSNAPADSRWHNSKARRQPGSEINFFNEGYAVNKWSPSKVGPADVDSLVEWNPVEMMRVQPQAMTVMMMKTG